ncbi:phospholipid transport system substrate-binding protein [Novimethylophilus kurashikiensis]|uniref:Phospholipid transport system substrate-binding protein n=1 Tax=Novimethylophilus kurashikiensis TaxID=1825523 RepID=A0A2R5FGK1_9PROT|nr:ABC transporter substrate-binding protein [Novimethylophilus kurashikiensis]GBG15351.1 phospholipid transport system substrate-binding protein [Novimethylophilus kurashikiensis]
MKLIRSFLVAALLMTAAHANAEAVPPDALVKQTATEVLDAIKKDKDIQNGDMKKIVALTEEKILPHFDFERMSRIVLGRNWTKASKEQQTQFVTEFRTLLVRTYSSALAKYRNQTIDYKPLRAASGDTDVTVKTEIIQPGGPAVPVDYTLEKKNDEWKVYDVAIEGVSLVTNYRGQFANEIKSGGMDGLIQRLVDKNKQNNGSASKQG